ncbi:MAG: Hpt domain-containing protein [Terricaulis sp.]
MNAVLDRAHFDHMTGADRALQREVLELFRAQVSGWTSAIASPLEWRHAVHTLKGSARGIGFHELAAACEATEAAADGARAERLGALGAALGKALTALDQFVVDTGLHAL